MNCRSQNLSSHVQERQLNPVYGNHTIHSYSSYYYYNYCDSIPESRGPQGSTPDPLPCYPYIPVPSASITGHPANHGSPGMSPRHDPLLQASLASAVHLSTESALIPSFPHVEIAASYISLPLAELRKWKPS